MILPYSWTDLNEIGETCGKKRVGRIMQLNRIKAVRGYKTRADIFDYIEILYNRTRRQSHLGGVSPKVFEQASS